MYQNICVKGAKYLKYKEIANNKEINAYLQKGNANLGQLGFTDHSKAHCVQVAHQAGKILKRLGYSEHEIELAKIAGYMHDIGNAINRKQHAEYGALLAGEILTRVVGATPLSVLNHLAGGVLGLCFMMAFISLLLNSMEMIDKGSVLIPRQAKVESRFYNSVKEIIPTIYFQNLFFKEE